MKLCCKRKMNLGEYAVDLQTKQKEKQTTFACSATKSICLFVRRQRESFLHGYSLTSVSIGFAEVCLELKEFTLSNFHFPPSFVPLQKVGSGKMLLVVPPPLQDLCTWLHVNTQLDFCIMAAVSSTCDRLQLGASRLVENSFIWQRNN